MSDHVFRNRLRNVEVVLYGTDTSGNRITVTGAVKDTDLQYVRDWDKPEAQNYKLVKKTAPITLTFVPKGPLGEQVKVQISGVQRTARVWVPRLSEEELTFARLKAGVTRDCEFEVDRKYSEDRDTGLYLLFRWWEN